MATKKSKRDKKRKGRLSDKDIIKLIKKLRPKTQQIVRVNVGDKGDKKGSSVANPFGANLVPVRTYAEPFQQQQPFQPPPAPAPAPLQVNQQPLLKPPIPPFVPLKVPPYQGFAYPYESEAEPPTPVKVRKTRTSRTSRKAAEELPVAAEPEPEPRFKAPRGYVGSSLGATASEPSYFQPPMQNDRYLQPIFEDTSRDSAGVVSQPLTSDEWTGTPEGFITEEPVAAAAAAESTVVPAEPEPLETVPASEETFVGRPIGAQSAVDKIRSISAISAFAEEEPDWTQNVKLAEILPPTPPEAEIRPATAAPVAAGEVDPFLFNRLYEFDYMDKLVRDAPLTAQGLMKNEIVEKLKGGFTGVPKEYLTKTGRLKSKIPVKELFNLYVSL